MKIKSTHTIIAVIALIIAMYFVKPVYQITFGFIKIIFEGNSYGKTILFFAWLIIFFGALFLKDKAIIKIKKNNSKKIITFFVIAVLVSWATALMLNTYLTASNDSDFKSTIGTISEENGITEWQASFLKHLHTGKIAMGLISKLLPNRLIGADSGIPLYNISPFPEIFAVAFIIMIILAVLLAIKEGLNNHEKYISIRTVLWATLSYGLIISMLDGGFLSIISQINLGLLFFYWLIFESKLKLRPLHQFFAPIFLLAGTYFTISYFTSMSFYANYGISLLAAIMCFCIIKLNWGKNFHKKIWISLLILLIAYSSVSAVNFGFGDLVQKDNEIGIFIYGLPEQTTNLEIKEIASEFGLVSDIEKTGWIALLNIKAKKDFRTEELNELLNKKLKPTTYLYAVGFGQTKTQLTIDVPADLKTIREFEKIKSKFVSFKKTTLNGKAKLMMTTPLNSTYSILYILNYMQFELNQKNPIVIG